MKKVFLTLLVAAMGFVACENKAAAPAEEAQATATEAVEGDLAYVRVDYVLAESDIFKSEGIALRDKTEKTQQKWAKKEQNLQNDMQQLAEKYQKGLITTRSAQEKEQELQKRAASMQTAAQKEGKELEEESIVFQNRMNDLLMRAIQEINADKKYKLIINANSLMDADTTLNITAAVLAKANELYAKEKDEVKAE